MKFQESECVFFKSKEILNFEYILFVGKRNGLVNNEEKVNKMLEEFCNRISFHATRTYLGDSQDLQRSLLLHNCRNMRNALWNMDMLKRE